jgi:hypothetical protein
MHTATGVCLRLIVAGLIWLGGCAPDTAAPAGQAATITGFVYRDLDADGARDRREPGEPGIVVSVYDANNRLICSTTTDVNGDYVLNPELNPSMIVRGKSYVVMFSGLPPGIVSGPAGVDSGTEVQFAEGGASNVSFGLFNPDQFVPPATPAG